MIDLELAESLSSICERLALLEAKMEILTAAANAILKKIELTAAEQLAVSRLVDYK